MNRTMKYKNPDGLMFIDPRTDKWMPFFDSRQIEVLEKLMNDGHDASLIAYPFIPADKMEFLRGWFNMSGQNVWGDGGLIGVPEIKPYYFWLAGQLDLPKTAIDAIMCLAPVDVNIYELVDDLTQLDNDLIQKLIILYWRLDYHGYRPFKILNDKSLTLREKRRKIKRMIGWRMFWLETIPHYALVP